MLGRIATNPRSARPRTPAAFLLLAALMGAGACSDETVTSVDEAVPPLLEAHNEMWDNSGDERLKVLSRNVYVGADIAPLLTVDFSDIVAVVGAASTAWTAVQQNNFLERAEALADEIAASRPHLVGLQEMAQFVTLDAAFNPTGTLSYPQILGAALAARGLDYDMIVQPNTNLTVPVALGPSGVTEWINFTEADAVLVRGDMAVQGAPAQGNYVTEFAFGPGLAVKRGWIRVTTELEGTIYNFVNTHLETQGLAPVHAGQAIELRALLAGLGDITILVGDLNSDANAGPGAPSWTPTYGELIGDGFVDLWAQAHPGNNSAGVTCCHDKDLINPPGQLDQRIDFVLVRDPALTSEAVLPGSIKVEILGEEAGDVTPSNRWPSDHAGVLAGMRLPRGLLADGG